MDLQLVWFLLIAVLWAGYLVLEGFDFGVGVLVPVLARDERERRQVINTIGPVWDGNEVWLIVAGGATFAAFPEWYATLFSGFYLPLLAILLALIVRGVAFEYRGKVDSPAWRQRWDACLVVGSLLPALLWGVAFSDIVAGVPLDADHRFTGTLLTLLGPYALLGGLTTLGLFVLHGALFLQLRTLGPVRERARVLAGRLSVPVLVVAGAWALWTQLAHGEGWTWAAVGVAAAALAVVVVAVPRGREGVAFAATCAVVVSAVVLIFGSLFPDVMPSSTDPAHSLTIRNASSTHYTLVVMTWVAAALLPLVLAYQAWSLWVFRHRLSVEHIPVPAVPAPRAELGATTRGRSSAR
ncbi:cytochrome d ubiquinol oxidase subunit II [Quadrisphaera sp. KR29]|uniref:cytochrome d ubiquinol oxidase subunit II n=1 Tax=Quadrisphaera sp. KR29 TaxID=3461391 RepID=UPI004043C4F3